MDSDSAQLHKSRTSTRTAFALLALLAAILLAEAVYTCLRAATIYDEGGYLYEGWMVCAHGLRPYVDFHTKVTPLLYYLYGWPQALFGPGLLVGRVEAAALSLLALALVCLAVARRYGPASAILAAAAFAGCLTGLDQHCRALAIAPCSLWIALGILGISLQPSRWGTGLTGLGAGLLFLTRQDLVAPALVLLVLSAVAGKRARIGGYCALIALFLVAAVMARFVLSSKPAVLNVLSLGLIHETAAKLGPMPFAATEKLSLHNLPWYLVYLARVYVTPIVWLLAALVIALTKPVRQIIARHPVPAACLGVSMANPLFRGLGALATHRNAFYLRDFYIEIALMAGAAVALAAAWRASRASLRPWVAAAGVVGLLLGPMAMRPPTWLHAHGPTDLQGLREAGRFIASETTAQDRIFALEDPQAFLDAGRSLLPLLTHHLFLYRPTTPTEALRGTKSFNLAMLLNMLGRDATVAVITQRGMTWIAHNERTDEGARVVAAVRDELRRGWTRVAEDNNSFLGAIEIYRRKAPSPQARPRRAAPQVVE